MDKMYVQIFNLTTGKKFSLPTLYTNRTEACVCGQNYIRDRQQENYDTVFYRVLIAEDGKVAEPSYFTIIDDDEEDEIEEPSSDSLAEILSAFNAIRPNY